MSSSSVDRLNSPLRILFRILESKRDEWNYLDRKYLEFFRKGIEDSNAHGLGGLYSEELSERTHS